MAADIERERAIAFPERRDHGVPARPGVGEAVQEDDVARHRIRIMTAIDTYLLLRAFCDELARCGMEHACTAPGSRNTPIVLSLVRQPRIHSWSHLDERCAGFFALGAAKRSGRPGGRDLHLGHGGGQPGAGGDRGPSRARAADRAHRGPPAGAARGRRRPDDRPAEALRRRRQVVLRGRSARCDAGFAALDPHAGLSRLLDRRPGSAGPRPPELPAARAARSRRGPSRRRHRARRRPTVRDARRAGAGSAHRRALIPPGGW